eukprot:scaffold4378_cov241-Alexandrium_tamarense.AAC.1
MSHMCICPQNFVVVGDSIELAMISIVSYFQDALASHALGMLLDVLLSIDILEGSGQELLLSPASVLKVLLSSKAFACALAGKQSLLISVLVEPESKSTFSILRDCSVAIVSHISIVTGV